MVCGICACATALVINASSSNDVRCLFIGQVSCEYVGRALRMIGMMKAKNRARNAAREIASESLWGLGCARKKGRKSGHCTNTRIAEKVSWEHALWLLCWELLCRFRNPDEYARFLPASVRIRLPAKAVHNYSTDAMEISVAGKEPKMKVERRFPLREREVCTCAHQSKNLTTGFLIPASLATCLA